MGDHVLELNGFRRSSARGELHNTLREAFPALLRRLLHGRNPDSLEAREFWAVQDVSFGVHAAKCWVLSATTAPVRARS